MSFEVQTLQLTVLRQPCVRRAFPSVVGTPKTPGGTEWIPPPSLLWTRWSHQPGTPLCGRPVTESSVCGFCVIFFYIKKIYLVFFYRKKVKDRAILQVRSFFLLVNRTQEFLCLTKVNHLTTKIHGLLVTDISAQCSRSQHTFLRRSVTACVINIILHWRKRLEET